MVVGRRGSVFRLDSLRYGDCCTLPVDPGWRPSHFAVGTDGATAVLVDEGQQEIDLEVFRGDRLIQSAPMADLTAPLRIVWSGSNRSVAVAGESKTRVVSLPASGSQGASVKNFDCGAPVALNSAGSRMACVAPDSGKVQYRNVLTGSVEREFDGHAGPVQELFVDGEDTLTAAGTYMGRNQTLVTVWKLSNGAVVSQRFCRIDGSEKRQLDFCDGDRTSPSWIAGSGWSPVTRSPARRRAASRQCRSAQTEFEQPRSPILC